MTTFTQHLIHNIKAGVPVLRVDTDEEGRTVLEIQQIAWGLTKGKKWAVKEAKDLKALAKALKTDALDLLEGNLLSVDGERLHALLDKVEPAVGDILEKAVASVGYRIITWDINNGFSDADPKSDESFAENLRGALAATCSPSRFQGHIVFVFKDCHPYLGQNADDPLPRRVLRDLVENASLTVRGRVVNDETGEAEERVDCRTLLFTQPGWKPHSDIDHYFVSVEFEMPDDAAIAREIEYVKGSIRSSGPDIAIPADVQFKLQSTLRGLTQYEITNILAVSAVAHGGFSMDMVKQVQRMKAKTFEREESLSWVDPDAIPSIDSFAGFDAYLEWIAEAREAYTPEAIAAGIKPDKGVLLLGIPGTGKSMVAKATAKAMDLPLIQFDFSSVLGSFVGQSEENMRRVLRRVSGEGACVLFIDEADKAFSNIAGPQSGSNVEQHVFGQLISWMANDNKAAFVIMTMNRLKGVPIEMVRSGRISAVYYTTFPTAIEREEILKLKLADAGCDPTVYTDQQYAELAHKCDQYVGAELEEVVKKAVKTSWKKRKSIQPTFMDLAASIGRVRPVAALDAENIAEINLFCKTKAESVSKPKERSRRILARGHRSVDLGPADQN